MVDTEEIRSEGRIEVLCFQVTSILSILISGEEVDEALILSVFLSLARNWISPTILRTRSPAFTAGLVLLKGQRQKLL